MGNSLLSPIGAVGRGLLAGAAATGAMTAAQTAYYKATGSETSSTPGEVACRVLEGVFRRQVSEEQVSGVLTTGMHWLYGTGWGVPYGLVAGSRTKPRAFAGALGLAVGVWGGVSRAGMSAMQLAPPPWEDPAKMLAMDLGFHFVYGAAGAAAFRVLS